LLGVALLLVVDSATATPGALDPSFGSSGIVETTIASGSTAAAAVAVQPDGKIVAGGETAVGSEDEFALARYNLNGSLDPSFGTGGKVTTAVGSLYDHIHALLLQTDGKIVAAGDTYDGSEYQFALARYNPGGSLDTTFGTGGKVVTPIAASGGGEAYAMALQTDGKIVVGGSSGDNRDFVIARYNPTGSLDTSFGTGGVVMTAIGNLSALALQPDGKVVAVGSALARYNPDGSLDTSFGTGGTVRGTPWGQAAGSALVLQPDGKIVVGGTSGWDFGTQSGFALYRFDPDGSVDTTFGDANGYVVTAFGNPSSAWGAALAQQPDGKLVQAGYYGSTEYGFALARYDADGSLDPGFGNSGIVTTPLGAHGAVADAVALEPEGKIVAAGTTQTGSNDPTGEQFALARYLVTSTLSTSTSGNGSGVVTSNPPGIDCGSACTETFTQPVPVTLTATPAAGSIFTGWSGGGGCSGTTGSCQVEMSSDQSVTATFALAETLSITTAGSGIGKVTSMPAGITCGSACSHAYAYGTTVTLTASPSSGSSFKGWSGACSGTGTCTVTTNAATTVTATFKLIPKPCLVPRAKGKTLKRAKSLIRAHACSVGKVKHITSRTVAKGQVIAQKPKPGKRLRHGAKVNLVVGRGP
jgi:uncharacterized delta-60 repeat protein